MTMTMTNVYLTNRIQYKYNIDMVHMRGTHIKHDISKHNK